MPGNAFCEKSILELVGESIDGNGVIFIETAHCPSAEAHGDWLVLFFFGTLALSAFVTVTVNLTTCPNRIVAAVQDSLGLQQIGKQ